MTPAEFEQKLEKISRRSGVPYARLIPIQAAEDRYTESIAQFGGYHALAKAFKCFFLETVEEINAAHPLRSGAHPSLVYPLLLERIALYIKNLWAAQGIADKGYPLAAYTLLRNIFDGAVLTSAAAQGKTDFYRLEGLIPGAHADKERFRKNRITEERAIRPLMTGKDSGLSAETIAQLAKWDTLFDDETHAGTLSRMQSLNWLKGDAPLTILPEFNQTSFSMFVNRFCEIGWMIHRLLPLTGTEDGPFSSHWKENWRALDECFYVIVEALFKDNKKLIALAIVELVTKKFPFNENSKFWE